MKAITRIRATAAPVPAAPRDSDEVLDRARAAFDTLAPELRRAARWVSDHASDVALLSMREQARQAGVSAPTMIRLARALGFADYASLRRPFQDAITGAPGGFRRRASELQSAPGSARIGSFAHDLIAAQVAALQSLQTLNTPAQIEETVKAIARARRVGFLGVRASFSIAYYFRYAYNLIATNGVLFDGLGGILPDQTEVLDRRDVLVAISQSPYSMPTVQALDAAAQRDVTIVALTDSAMSPLARPAEHLLLFHTESLSFFPSTIGALGLVELLLARLAARGGRPVLDRLAEVEGRLAASRAYWSGDRHGVRA
jgi:DNA-binding MurR/RpiR family transcriptional regulator